METIGSTTLFLTVAGLSCVAGAVLIGFALRGAPGPSTSGTGHCTGPAPGRTEDRQPDDEAHEDGAHAAAIQARLHTLSLGPDALDDTALNRHRKAVTRIAAAVRELAVDPHHTPRRPGLLPQLLRALDDDEGARHELVQLIARDPALVANLLRLANSALYRRGPEPVESIAGAIALLGTTGVRSLVATAVMQPMFQRRAGQFPAFAEITWQHTLYAAAAAETHAALVEKDDRFAAQLLGLLNGLGSIVVFRIALERYAAIPGHPPHAAVIAGAIDTHGPGAAARIAQSWDVSQRLQQALLEQQRNGAGDPASPLGRSLAFGRLLGTLALLYEGGAITKPELHAALSASGAPARHVQRIWLRVTANRD